MSLDSLPPPLVTKTRKQRVRFHINEFFRAYFKHSLSLSVNLGHIALSALFQEWKKATTASTTEPEEPDSPSDGKAPKTASPPPSKMEGGESSSGNKTKEDSSLVGKILGLGQKGASKGDVPAVPPKDSTPVSPNKFSLARSDFLNFLFVYFFRNLSPYLICPGTPL